MIKNATGVVQVTRGEAAAVFGHYNATLMIQQTYEREGRWDAAMALDSRVARWWQVLMGLRILPE